MDPAPCEGRIWGRSWGNPSRLTGYLHHPPESRLLWSSHEEEDWQILEEEDSNPVWHGVGARAPEVPVDDDDGDQNGDGVHDEGEEQVLGDQRQDERRRRKNF